jgi:hypothetical protein
MSSDTCETQSCSTPTVRIHGDIFSSEPQADPLCISARNPHTVIGLIHLTQKIVKSFKARSTGHIISLGSVAGVEAYVGGGTSSSLRDPHALMSEFRMGLIFCCVHLGRCSHLLCDQVCCEGIRNDAEEGARWHTHQGTLRPLWLSYPSRPVLLTLCNVPSSCSLIASASCRPSCTSSPSSTDPSTVAPCSSPMPSCVPTPGDRGPARHGRDRLLARPLPRG